MHIHIHIHIHIQIHIHIHICIDVKICACLDMCYDCQAMPFYVMSHHLISRHVMLYMLNITQSLITSQSLKIKIYVYLSFLYLLIDGPIYLPFHTPSILAIILPGSNSHGLLKKRTDRPNGFPGWDVLYVRKMSGHMFWTHYLGVDFGPLVLLLHPSTTSLSLESERILCRFCRETDQTSSKPTTSHKITRFCKNLISTIEIQAKITHCRSFETFGFV